jgi:hypothetical protein
MDGDDEGQDADSDAGMDADEDILIEEPPSIQASKSFLSPLLQPLLALVQPTALSFPPTSAQGGGPSPHPPTTSALSSIHVCALECLNNLFLALSSAKGVAKAAAADVATGQQVWDAVWSALAAVGTNTTDLGQERRRDMWDMAVGVLWGIGGVWKGNLVRLALDIDLTY